ncbi:amidophosphoribosyltransferase [Maritimibacter sp. 55A14]|uniref:double zinc ribbon domain-containing protein n=1 Tax=Maritimibacter sp. 55A14 TaxID=2174844 RepID=UPI000D60664A|nr:double zinc ribbon domain-containing protein [Maritimibacter sp. 55A14]PWE33527.1 amidophosphoribosyltransferase [Maritimibacter sp. 55A14]
MVLQTAIRLLYPPQCISCDALVETEFGLCGSSWAETPFLSGLACDMCGLPLPGEAAAGPEFCDTCLTHPKPWGRGRAALRYEGRARKLILGLKHGDRVDLARPAAAWLARAAAPLIRPETLVVPVPLHWRRLLARRYNQAALLSRGLAATLGLPHCPDLLTRPRATPTLDGLGRAERQAALAGRISAHPRRAARAKGRHLLVVDDVMTSGATLSAATEAALAAGAAEVDVVALARVAQDT